MSGELAGLCWPRERLGEALVELAIRSGLATEAVEVAAAPADADEGLRDWLEVAADGLDLAVQSRDVLHADLEIALRRLGPTLCLLPPGGPGAVAVLGGGRRWARVLGPDLTVHKLPLSALRAALCGQREARELAEVEELLGAAGVAPRRRDRARAALLGERLATTSVHLGWALQLPASAGLWQQIRRTGLWRRAITFVVAHAVLYGLWIASWILVGRATLQGRTEPGWLAAWALLLLTLVPLQLLGSWCQGLFVLGAGGLLKRRLLLGALRLHPQEVRHLGAGQHLGRVLESEAVESLAVNGGMLGAVAVVELAMAALVLLASSGSQLLLLAGWLAGVVWLGWRHMRSCRSWTAARLDLTHDLVERMVGHRTRLAQQPPERWHLGEDETLRRYLASSRATDRWSARLLYLVPRGWLVLGLAGLMPAFLAAAPPTTLAIGLGGVLLAYRALGTLVGGLWQLAGARVAWDQVGALYRAAGRPRRAPSTAPAAVAQDLATLLQARELCFAYEGRRRAALQNCSLRIDRGDRLLLEGPSGSGKSTLVALLTGLHQPDGGLLLVGGQDARHLSPEAWRRRVAAAPQFHDNHVLSGTLLFNLLLARSGPPAQEDVAAAQAVCRDLGLDELLERMPAGLLQHVGETGWQLSHGERSRLYVARALLQEAAVVVFDESFAALDPETLQQVLAAVMQRAPTLLVVAHP